MISLTAGLSSSTFSGSGFNFNICADPRVEGQADLFHSTRSDILDFPDAKARQTTQSAWDELIHLLALSVSQRAWKKDKVGKAHPQWKLLNLLSCPTWSPLTVTNFEFFLIFLTLLIRETLFLHGLPINAATPCWNAFLRKSQLWVGLCLGLRWSSLYSLIALRFFHQLRLLSFSVLKETIFYLRPSSSQRDILPSHLFKEIHPRLQHFTHFKHFLVIWLRTSCIQACCGAADHQKEESWS